MAQAVLPSPDKVVKGKPLPSVYTVMVIVGALALGVTIGFVLFNLLSPVANGGYGLEFGSLFEMPKAPSPPAIPTR